MTDSELLIDAFDARVERRDQRRAFFKTALSIGGFVVAGAAAAQTAPTPTPTATPTITDADVLNFALNLEYLEANFYSYAVFGTPIDTTLQTGATGATSTQGTAVSPGAHAVTFADPLIAQYAREIAEDEIAHVKFLRNALGTAAVAQPKIDVGTAPTGAFSTAAQSAGLITAGQSFDPYSSDLAFLYGAFIFEDVGVTAYKGASPLITNKAYLDAAAGILATEAYHASIVRTSIDQMGGMPGLKASTIRGDTELVSGARDSLDGASDLDQGLNQMNTGVGLTSNIVPTDGDGIAFSRTTGQVLNIVYLNKAAVTMGGFFPAGVNGIIRTSANNA